ncbi:MAG: hypothetical protein RL336_1055 [Pseudomonadota bacterium]
MRYVLMCMLVLLSSMVRAELTIEITQGQDNPVAIAVVPFAAEATEVPEDIQGIVAADLYRSGRFSLLPAYDMLSQPHTEADVFYNEWRAVEVEYVLIGRIANDGFGRIRTSVELFDVLRQSKILEYSAAGGVLEQRDVAHAVSDAVFEKLTGMPGAFSTKIAYVSGKNEFGDTSVSYNNRLMIADVDGARERQLLESSQPILSPSWSPDATKIAYVSFEDGRPAIYIYDLATNVRQKITAFPGLNSAPAWSPDGRYLAMVLSKSGNPDIYVLDLETRKLRQMTKHYGIDTEPSWLPDGSALVYTSDRAGQPQIYQVDMATGYEERLTFDGNYNARARVLLDGSGIVLIHRSEGYSDFHIALQNIERGTIKVLTTTVLDESPTVAPNGSTVLYATRDNGRGILAAVSVDGNVKYNIPSNARDVREPAWSPYISDHTFFLKQ